MRMHLINLKRHSIKSVIGFCGAVFTLAMALVLFASHRSRVLSKHEPPAGSSGGHESRHVSSPPPRDTTHSAAVQQGSGVDLSGERAALISDFNQNQSRSRIVRLVADNSAFKAAEYNRAFVLMQYFGYLRRDPDQGGYDFWLDVLNNRVPGNFRGMVCAFITSAEYQNRFSSIQSRTDSVCAGIGQ